MRLVFIHHFFQRECKIVCPEKSGTAYYRSCLVCSNPRIMKYCQLASFPDSLGTRPLHVAEGLVLRLIPRLLLRPWQTRLLQTRLVVTSRTMTGAYVPSTNHNWLPAFEAGHGALPGDMGLQVLLQIMPISTLGPGGQLLILGILPCSNTYNNNGIVCA